MSSNFKIKSHRLLFRTLPVILTTTISFNYPSLIFAQAPQTEALYNQLKIQKAYSKATALALLPQEMKENFILVKNSESRQKGTYELPRILHFNKIGNFIVTSSGHSKDQDKAANDLEIMEFLPSENRWSFATVSLNDKDINPPVYNSRNCLNCHGENPRPIWGSYPEWSTTYGGDPRYGTDQMGPEEKLLFDQFVEKAQFHDAYKHLKIIVTKSGYQLPSIYPNPNSVFTARLARHQVNYIFQKIQKSSAAKNIKFNFLARLFHCSTTSKMDIHVTQKYSERLNTDLAFSTHWNQRPEPLDTMTRLLRLMDTDPSEDYDLTIRQESQSPVESSEGLMWNAGSDPIGDMVGFRVLKYLTEEDPLLQSWLSEAKPMMDKIEHYSFLSSAKEITELDKDESSRQYMLTIYPFLRYNLYYSILGHYGDQLCQHFISEAQN